MNGLHLELFFTYETKIPNGVGFSLFGLGHILWLAVIVVTSVLYLKRYAKAAKQKKRRMEYVISFSLVGWIVVRIVYIAVIKEDFLYELPLHMCSIAGMLCAVHCIFGWKWLGQVLYAVCLPGTILALLFPNWSFYPVIHMITVESFWFHAGIIMYVTGLLYTHKIVPDLRKMWQVVLFLAAVVTPVYFFDRRYEVNYMFVNKPSPGSPLEWLAEWLGNPGYLIGYAVLVGLCIFLMDLGYVLIVRKRHRIIF